MNGDSRTGFRPEKPTSLPAGKAPPPPTRPSERRGEFTEDERKAMLQLIAMFDAYPAATGLSHLMGLIIRDALKGREIRIYGVTTE